MLELIGAAVGGLVVGVLSGEKVKALLKKILEKVSHL